ncbi:MAG: metallophosphoesterase family protein [Kiritimatiellae bacterium]|nr:metallophosphoesterase family protein [Kiritimatiellia bacterium]
MRYAVMSDIHANPWALERALADAREQGAEKFVCLGDVVGYGPDAVGAVELARSVFDVALMGNHDAATVGLISSWNFRPEAKAGFLRHGIELGAEALSWLRGLPHVYRGELFAAAHGSLVNPEAFAYILREGDALAAFEAMDATPLLFVGHTHLSLAVERTGRSRVRVREADRLELSGKSAYIVNAGSVGYPRNEPESVYALYDSDQGTVIWRRLPFDYGNYVARMRAKRIELPGWLVEDAAAAENGQEA